MNLNNLKLKTLLSGAMVVALLLLIVIISVINIGGFSSMFNKVTENELLPAFVERAKLKIENELSAPVHFSESIAQNHFIQQWMKSSEPQEQLPDIVQYMQGFVDQRGATAVFWVSAISQHYYTQDGLFKTVSQSEPRDSWFFDTVRGGKDIGLNLDPDEKTKTLTVYVNVLAKDRSGKVLGVAGLGYDVSDIIDIVEQNHVGESGYMFMLDASNRIVAHPNEAFIGKSIDQLSMSSSVLSSLAGRGDDFTLFEGQVKGEDVYIAAEKLTGLGWSLVTVLPQAEIRGQVNSVIRNSVVSGIILTVIFAFIAFLFANRVSRSITQVGDKLKNMAASGGDLTQKLDDRAGNELGYLAGGFNSILNTFADMVRQVMEAEEAINHGVVNLKKTSDESLKYSEDQRQQTEMVATAITEMGQTISEVSSIAQKTASDTTSAVDDIHTTNDVMEHLSETMSGLAESMKGSESAIRELATQAETINSVVDVISNISEQTNLLALNAAIEAARAGEQGRGFAVVADEVRTLANRTQESTQEIRSQIERLQSAATSSLQAIQSGARSSSELAERAESASSSLTGIRNRFDSISDGNIQVAAATEEQSSAVEHINQSAVEISAMASGIHSQSQSQIEEIRLLTNQAEKMRRTIRQFKV